MTLHISPELDLPLEAITETFAILAKRGAGKSNAAVVMAEEMYDNGLPWVAIDPKGDWWGVRAAGDGKSPGLEVVVFGGQHGDVPLEPTAGNLVADLIVDTRLTCVLDVSEFSKADRRRFLVAFADRLYRRNTEPLHVFCEEADEYIPQRVMGEDARLVGAFETLVKRGRTHGLGITLITQRSASLNKDVLTQIETLIPMRTPSPQDDPKVLRARIRELETRLAEKPAPVIERVEVPVFDDATRKLIAETTGSLVGASIAFKSFADRIDAAMSQQTPTPVRDRSPRGGQPQGRGEPTRAAKPSTAPAPRPARADVGLTGPQQRVLDALAWLDVVGFPQPTKIQVGFIAGYRVGKKVGGTFGNVLGQLRAEGLIDYPNAGTVALTPEGSTVATVPDIERTTEGLQQAINARLAEPERRVLAGIIAAHPDPIGKQAAGEQAGYTVGSKVGGTFGNILGRLRSLGLIDYPAPGLVIATDVLFLQ
jgi:hypothetical protein